MGIKPCKHFFTNSTIFASYSKALRSFRCHHHLATSVMIFLWQCRKTCIESFPSPQSFPVIFSIWYIQPFPKCEVKNLFLQGVNRFPHYLDTTNTITAEDTQGVGLALSSVLVTFKINLSNPYKYIVWKKISELVLVSVFSSSTLTFFVMI